jgi:hypothetical protein
VSAVTVLGIAGTVQTGKSELAPVFEECGFQFLDLNDPQCDLRAKGTARYDLFETHYPGALKPCGSKTGKFYDLVSPEFYHARVREDTELVVPLVLEWLNAAGSHPVALAWEYLPAIAHRLPLDHTLLFVTEEQVWMERLRERLKSRGAEGDVTDERIHRIIDLLDVWPDKILLDVDRSMRGKYGLFDVSAPEWNANELRPLLRRLRKTGPL